MARYCRWLRWFAGISIFSFALLLCLQCDVLSRNVESLELLSSSQVQPREAFAGIGIDGKGSSVSIPNFPK